MGGIEGVKFKKERERGGKKDRGKRGGGKKKGGDG